LQKHEHRSGEGDDGNTRWKKSI